MNSDYLEPVILSEMIDSGKQIVNIHDLTLLWKLPRLGLLLRVMRCQVGLMVSHRRLVHTFSMTMFKEPLLMIACSSAIINTKTSRNRA